MKKTFVQVLALALAVVLCVVGFSACSGSSNASPERYYETTAAATYAENGRYETVSADMAAASADLAAAGGANTAYTGEADLYQPADSRKIIYRADMSVQTEHYDESVEAIYAQISACGGYIESSSSSRSAGSGDRSLSLTVRVPAERFREFMDAKDSFGVVRNADIYQEDVTFSYIDMEARLETLETKRERLMALLEKATEMEDIIELESALSDTVYQIESYTSSLKRLDDQIGYSTVCISLAEVYRAVEVPETPKTLGERISQRFASTMDDLSEFGEGLLVFLIGASPVLVILALLIAVIVLICRAALRRSRRRLEAEHARRRELEAKAKENKPEDETK